MHREGLRYEEWDGTLVEGFFARGGAPAAEQRALAESEWLDELETALDDFLTVSLQGEIDHEDPQLSDSAAHLRVGRVHVGLSRLAWPTGIAVAGLVVSLALHSPGTGIMAGLNLLRAIHESSTVLSEEDMRLLTWISNQQRAGEPCPMSDAPSDVSRLMQRGVLRTDREGNLRLVL